MSDHRRFERSARAWLEEGPDRVPDRVLEAAFHQMDFTPQRRGRPIPWRFQTMPTFVRALAAVVVIGLAAGGALLVQRSSEVVGRPSPTPSQPTPAPSASTSAVTPGLDPASLTAAFVSDRYGYTLPVAPDWTTHQATVTWTGPDNSTPVIDELAISGTPWFVNGASQALAQGQTFDDWIDLFQSAENAASACFGGPESQWPTRTLGGHDWKWVRGCQAVTAITETAGRAYVFTFGGPVNPPDDAIGLFDRMLESVELDPGSVAPPPTAPTLDGRFESAQHGFSLRYPADWAVEQRATATGPDDRMPVPSHPSLDVLGNEDLRLSVTSLPLPKGQSAADWAKQLCGFARTVWSPECERAPGVWLQVPLAKGDAWVAVDGDTAAAFPKNDSRLFLATAVAGGRAYEIRLEGNAEEALFLAILRSMSLDPASAAGATPRP